MNVLVGGGTGFIGQYLTEALTSRGDSVTILTRSPQKYTPTDKVSYKSWDDDLSVVVSEADAVINMAGTNLFEKRWTDAVKKEIIDSRVSSTSALVSAILMAKFKPKVFVSFSAVGYYGSRGSEKLTEDVAVGDDFLAHVCELWEAAALPVSESAVRLVIPRIGIVQQADDGALAKMLIPFNMFVGGPLGSGDQYYPWVHMADVVGMVLHAIDNDAVEGPMNVAAPEHGTMNYFAKTLGSVLGRPSFFPVPYIALRAAVGESAQAIVASARVTPAKALQTGYKFQFPELEPALRDILTKN